MENTQQPKQKEKVREKVKRARENVKRVSKEVTQGVKKEIKEDFFNVPNTLTLSRLFFAFIAVYLLFSGYSRILVAVIFSIAAITDFFDGYLARKLKQTTSIGARLDQVIDRIFTAIVVFALLFYFIKFNMNGIMLLALVSSREIIGLPGFIIRIIKNKDAYKVKYVGKITTLVQSFALAFIIAGFSFSVYFAIATCIVGILSGFDYLKDSLN
ncbi:MAG: CDP-alcohol phosphatidyltransferase family protein [Nanoarchaeota archaeon]|nr:CDP-alcohol phosphatidyltransferase family protein [Nanoarchaeota archaeon]